MCILLYYINDNPASGEYRLVLANNRDEFLERPTKPADFWKNDQNIISGLDMEPGKEGGTWFAVSKKGKIGILLNVLDKQDPNKLGRGSLVADYLTSALDGKSHLQKLEKSAKDYNSFSLITMELNLTSPSSTEYICQCAALNGYKRAEFGPGIHGFSNSCFTTPWNKPEIGKKKLSAIITECNSISQEDRLLEKLLTLLNDRTQYMPDEILEQCCINAYGNGKDVVDNIKNRSAISVWMPTFKYASRTNTVLLVDAQWNCVYTERTVEDFSDLNNLKWNTRTYRFKMAPFDESST